MGCGGSKQTETCGPPTSGRKGQLQSSSKQKLQQKKRNGSLVTANGGNSKKGRYAVVHHSEEESKDKSLVQMINDKGFKRRVRNKLQTATAGSDANELEKFMDQFQRHHLDDRDIRDAILRCHAGVLDKTIGNAECSQFALQLESQIELARQKLQQLKDWSDIQLLLCRVGKDSLLHEVRRFNSETVDQQKVNEVSKIIQPHELDSVRKASNGAAAFHVWCTDILKKVNHDRHEDEERKKHEATHSNDKLSKRGNRKTKGK